MERGEETLSENKDHSTRTISVVMAITLLGKVLGLFRDHLMAVHYGTTGMEAKAFYIASRIPRVFFDVVFASAIAACFIGGASPATGSGTILGALIGALVIGVLNNGLNLLNVNSFWQYVVKGTVILLAVFVDYLRNKKAE